jgi:hypothetical protein
MPTCPEVPLTTLTRLPLHLIPFTWLTLQMLANETTVSVLGVPVSSAQQVWLPWTRTLLAGNLSRARTPQVLRRPRLLPPRQVHDMVSKSCSFVSLGAQKVMQHRSLLSRVYTGRGCRFQGPRRKWRPVLGMHIREIGSTPSYREVVEETPVRCRGYRRLQPCGTL